MRSAIKNFLGRGEEQSEQTTTAPSVNVTKDVTTGPSIVRSEVVNETIKPIEVREVQPVVEVHREQKELHQVVQPLAAHQELPVQVHERTQPVQIFEKTAVIPDASRREMETGLDIQGQRTVQGVTATTVNKAPIIHEHIHKQVIEEIQPVVYKETIEPHLIKETVPIVERVVEAPTIIKEVRPIQTTTGAPLSGQPIQPTKF